MRFLLSVVLAQSLFAADPRLGNIKAVYLLPMTSGIDQYLASRLQQDQTLTITTDPSAADAILTDGIGPGFERKMTELYPPEPKPKPKPEKSKDEKKEKEEEPTAEKGDTTPPPISTFRRGRGVVFLVDRQSRQVMWSTHSRPKNATPRELERTAARMAERLRTAVKGK